MRTGDEQARDVGARKQQDHPGHGGAGKGGGASSAEDFPDDFEFGPGGLAVLWAEENSRDALFAAAVGQDVVTLETIFAGEDVVVGAVAVGPTWADKLAVKPDLTAQIARSLCEGADTSGTAPSYCWQPMAQLNADQATQVSQRAADASLNISSIPTDIFAEQFCMSIQPVFVTIDPAGQVTSIGIALT